MVRRPSGGETIVVASGKGGVGKTHLSLNLAIELSRRRLSTILVDADLGHANADILLDIAPHFDLAGLLNTRRHIEKLLTPGPAGLRLLCGISGLRHSLRTCSETAERFVDGLERVREAADVVVVDNGAGALGAPASFALIADQLIVITTPEPTALTDTYAALKLIYQSGFCARASLIVNMVRRRREAIETARRLQRVSEQFLGLSLEYLGHVPYDRHVIAAMRQREPFVLRYPYCPASRQIDAIARRITFTAMQTRPPAGVWGRVASLFF